MVMKIYSYWHKIYHKFLWYYFCGRLKRLIRKNKLKEAAALLERSHDPDAVEFVGNLKSVGARDVLIDLVCRGGSLNFQARVTLSVFSASMRKEGMAKYLKEFILNHKVEELTGLLLEIGSKSEFRKDLDAAINEILFSNAEMKIKEYIKLALSKEENRKRQELSETMRNSEYEKAKNQCEFEEKERKQKMKFCPRCNKEIFSDFYIESKLVGEWETHEYYCCRKCHTELNDGFGNRLVRVTW